MKYEIFNNGGTLLVKINCGLDELLNVEKKRTR